MKVGEASRKKPIKPPYEQYELPFTARREHYTVINNFMAPEEDENGERTGKYYWHSSQIMWRIPRNDS